MPLRTFDQSEIVLSARRRLESPLLLSVWVGMVGFAIAEGSAFYAAIGSVAVLVNLLVARQHREVFVARPFVNAGVLVGTGIMLLEVVGTRQSMLVTMGHWLILIQACKLFEQKRNRDYVQLLVLSLLLMVAGAMVCDRIWFAGVLLVHLALLCHSTMVLTLKRGLDAAASSRLSTDLRRPSAEQVAWNVMRDWPGRALLGRLWPVLTGILGTGVFMFVIAPRSAWPRPAGLRSEATSDFSASITLGQPRRIYLSDRVVMVVNVRSHDPSIPPQPVGYLRGRTLDTYADSSWSNSFKPFAPAVFEVPPPDALVQEVTMDAGLLPVLFAEYPAVQTESPDGIPRMDAELGLSLSAHGATGGMIRYTAWSWPQPLAPARRAWLTVNADIPVRPAGIGVHVSGPVAALAYEWCADLVARRDAFPVGPTRDRLDMAIAQRVLKELRGRCTYSLDLSGADPHRDGIEDFLLHLRRGHCEYFASAMVVLCRAMGVQARLVSGFRVEPAGQSAITVRGRDAHAWVEVYTPSTHWVSFDPTPPGRWEQASPWWSGVRDFWQSVRFFWSRYVVGYDEVVRRRLFRRFRDLWFAIVRGLRDLGRVLRDSFVNLLVHGQIDRALGVVSLVVSVVGVAALAVLMVRLVRRERARRRRLREGREVRWEHLRFLERLFRAMERRGLVVRADRTIRELLAEAARRFALPEPELNAMADLYDKVRWGLVPAEPGELAAAEAGTERLAGLVRRRPRLGERGRV